MPLISVILPTFNRADLLPLAVDSVLAQEFRDFEIIVVDDGSTDRTPAVLAGYAADPALAGRMQCLRQENTGQGAARNLGIRHARGEYCAFLDSDDLLFPWSLGVIADAIEQNGRPGLVLGAELRFDAMDAFRATEREPLRVTTWPDLYAYGIAEQLRGAGETIARTDLLQKVGGFATERVMGEDTDLLLRMGTAPNVIKIQAPATYGYRMHVGMFTASAALYRGVGALVRRYRAGVFPRGERDAHATMVVGACAIYCCRTCLMTGDVWKSVKMGVRTADILLRALYFHLITRTPIRIELRRLFKWGRLRRKTARRIPAPPRTRSGRTLLTTRSPQTLVANVCANTAKE